MDRTRISGTTLALFSIRSRRDWGIGQITDLPVCAAWIRTAGQSLVQILPPHELSLGETSPYGALTAFGLDPIYLDVEACRSRRGRDPGRSARTARRSSSGSARPRASTTAAVRALKTEGLRARIRALLRRSEWAQADRRAPKRSRRSSTARRTGSTTSRSTPHSARRTAATAGRRGPRTSAIAASRALAARARPCPAAPRGRVRAVDRSLDQWATRTRRDARPRRRADGRPAVHRVHRERRRVVARRRSSSCTCRSARRPTTTRPTGKTGGCPPYDWLAMEADDLAWIRARARRAARLYDRFRLDHVVGYFRQWVRPRREVATPEKGRAVGPRGASIPTVPTRRRPAGAGCSARSSTRSGLAPRDRPPRASSPKTSASSRRSSARCSIELEIARLSGHPLGEGRGGFRDSATFPRASVGRLEHARHRAHHLVVGRVQRRRARRAPRAGRVRGERRG